MSIYALLLSFQIPRSLCFLGMTVGEGGMTGRVHITPKVSILTIVDDIAVTSLLVYKKTGNA